MVLFNRLKLGDELMNKVEIFLNAIASNEILKRQFTENPEKVLKNLGITLTYKKGEEINETGIDESSKKADK